LLKGNPAQLTFLNKKNGTIVHLWGLGSLAKNRFRTNYAPFGSNIASACLQ
jgi:hypothetical protein